MSKNYILSTLTNLDILETTLTEQELEPIKNEIREIQANFDNATPVNYKLIGHIKREYSLLKSREYLNRLVNPLLNKYVENYYQYEHTIDTNSNLSLDYAWVNFQQKHEFNPYHHHHGDISMVLWISIPYNMEDEAKIYPLTSGDSPKNGAFEFQYLNYTGEVKHKTILADKKYENKMIVFPAGLKHCVYPFYTSDEYRISVSGNFYLNKTTDDKFNLEYR